jgi:uncharacterized protein YegJ (DUF2314 family)
MRNIILAGVFLVAAGGAGYTTLFSSSKSDGKLNVNGVQLDAPKTDWAKIEGSEFTFRPSTEGSRITNSETYQEAKAAIDSEDNVVAVKTDDQVMAEAVAKARETLPRFYELMKAKTLGDYTVKYPLEEGGFTENIWVLLTDVTDDEFVGLLSNEPVQIESKKMGDQVRFAKADVKDWMIKNDKEIYGGYTMRVLLDKLPEDQSAALKTMLRD